MRIVVFFLFSTLTACAAMIPAPDIGTSYALFSLDDEPFAPHATIRFGPAGEIGGQAPCNTWASRLIDPLPAFSIEAITATEIACNALPAEAIFFNTLRLMTTAEVAADRLILRDDTHRSMVFVAVEQDGAIPAASAPPKAAPGRRAAVVPPVTGSAGVR